MPLETITSIHRFPIHVMAVRPLLNLYPVNTKRC